MQRLDLFIQCLSLSYVRVRYGAIETGRAGSYSKKEQPFLTLSRHSIVYVTTRCQKYYLRRINLGPSATNHRV